MSFARQLSICQIEVDGPIAPTDLEWEIARLQRPGMFGDRHIKQILHPGRYGFEPFTWPKWQLRRRPEPDAAQRRAGECRKPRRTRIENIHWQQMDDLDWTMVLPTDSPTIDVPVDNADDAGLGYYNCRLISPNDVIALSHRSIIVNFCYQDDYLERYVLGVRGGCSIEQHDFAHVDMPLDTHSGHLVIGKIDPVDQALELTAFKVRPLDRVYIPAQTIHTNDYLLGTWETLLSSACEFPSAQIKPSSDAVLDPALKPALPSLSFRT